MGSTNEDDLTRGLRGDGLQWEPPSSVAEPAWRRNTRNCPLHPPDHIPCENSMANIDFVQESSLSGLYRSRTK
ncbi:hypothetical protein RRG08_011825 [Elysia crispata]|uniref:Uncharacterized protein n=1 Tax=Elysia crispata TaxID=231223 RepID=A0AAE0ZLV6_9GAST|nr:hypothetical protein RRG08_011825 [Elysia crispata]